jgi:Na+/proline symporter
MSTADTRMLASSALFTQSIYRRFIRPDRTESHYLWVGRFASLGIVALSLILQTTFTDVIEALKFVLKTTAPIGISFWIGIIWRGWTPKAVWASSLAAYGMWALCAFFPQWLTAVGIGTPIVIPTLDHVKVADAWMMLLYLSTGVVTGVLVSFMTRRPPSEQLNAFFLLMRTPVQPGEHIAAPCTMPADPAPPLRKMFNHPDIEIPRPTSVDIIGFILAWVFVGVIVWIPYWLSRV